MSHFDHQNTLGGFLGSISTFCAIMIGTIDAHTLFQTAVCAGIGAGVGYVVTYTFKKITGWLERKLGVSPDKSENQS